MKKIIITLIAILSVSIGYSQDASFSQYNNSRLNTNPAFTGTDSTLVISANYRLQWPNMSATYQAVNCSVDKYIRIIRAGLGLNYFYGSEANGTYTKSRIDFNFAPHFELFKHKLVLISAF